MTNFKTVKEFTNDKGGSPQQKMILQIKLVHYLQ